MTRDSIRYKVSFPDARNHYLEVDAVYPVDGEDEIELLMAVWTPGSYLVREYSRHVEGLTARTAEGRRLEAPKISKNRWKIRTDGVSEIHLAYRVYCREMTVRSNWVEDDFAVLNGAPTFISMAGGEAFPHQVELNPPAHWKSSITGLAEDPEGIPHSYRAPDYDTLVDSLILVGNPALYEFEVDGKPHHLANLGEVSVWDGARCAEDVKRIVEQHFLFWGELPYDKYVFLNLLTEAEGGLEHKNSTLMMTSRWRFRVPSQYKRWLGLVSHEFFHTWNVKRLRPVELGPFEYGEEVYTASLWVAEGLTSYYDDLLLTRVGLYSQDDYLRALGRSIRALQTTPGRKVRSLEEVSLDAWIKHYRPDENSPNSSVSYYTKGAVVGFLLDARVRRITDGGKSLDDVMRLAYQRYSGDRGYFPEEFRATVSEVAGADLSAWFRKALESTDELEYQEALEFYGLRFKDPAREPDRDQADLEAIGWLGLESMSGNDQLLVRRVKRATPAFEAGLGAGDEIVALDGFRVDSGSWKDRLKQYSPGDRAEMLIARRQKLMTLPVRFGTRPADRWQLEVDDQAGDVQKRRLADWLQAEPSEKISRHA